MGCSGSSEGCRKKLNATGPGLFWRQHDVWTLWWTLVVRGGGSGCAAGRGCWGLSSHARLKTSIANPPLPQNTSEHETCAPAQSSPQISCAARACNCPIASGLQATEFCAAVAKYHCCRSARSRSLKNLISQCQRTLPGASHSRACSAAGRYIKLSQFASHHGSQEAKKPRTSKMSLGLGAVGISSCSWLSSRSFAESCTRFGRLAPKQKLSQPKWNSEHITA